MSVLKVYCVCVSLRKVTDSLFSPFQEEYDVLKQ